MAEATKHYSNGEVTIVWKPGKCIHSGNCVKGLPKVFNPDARPWINVEAASTDALIDQVKQCPSGALSYFMNDEGPEAPDATGEGVSVEVMENGPLMVKGTLNVTLGDGSTERKEKVTAFCRCGESSNKPYCDGAHRKVGFTG